MAQHGDYNDLQTFSLSLLTHYQTQGQWVWKRAKFIPNWAWYAIKSKVNGSRG